MPGFDYSRMQATASRLMGRFKQGVVTITKPGTQTPGDTSWDPPVTSDPVVYTLDATLKGVSQQFVNGTTILATDLEVTVAVFGAELEAGDTLSIDGKAMTIIKTMRIPAAGTQVVWKFIVRG